MCPEFILAFIYLVILLVINFLLFNLLRSYQKNIIRLLKVKNIFLSFEKKETELINLLYQHSKKQIEKEILLRNLPNFSKLKDTLIIGNIYQSILTSENGKENLNSFYFRLLQEQYLPIADSFE